MSSMYSACFSFSSPNIRSPSTSEKPMMALSGVRSSWDMLARNSDLCRLAASIWRLLSSISRNSRAFWIASTDWVAKVFRSSMTSGRNSPGVFRPNHQAADDAVFAQQGNGQAGAEAEAIEHLAHAALVGPGLRGCRGSGPARAIAAARPTTPSP